MSGGGGEGAFVCLSDIERSIKHFKQQVLDLKCPSFYFESLWGLRGFLYENVVTS